MTTSKPRYGWMKRGRIFKCSNAQCGKLGDVGDARAFDNETRTVLCEACAVAAGAKPPGEAKTSAGNERVDALEAENKTLAEQVEKLGAEIKTLHERTFRQQDEINELWREFDKYCKKEPVRSMREPEKPKDEAPNLFN